MSVPDHDKVIHRKDEFLDKLVITVAARIAEDIIFGPEKIGSGAAGDIQQVTSLARKMVTEFGYSEKLGRVRYSGNQEEVFLGHSVAQSKNISEQTARIIDEEVIRIVADAEKRARKILEENIKDLHIIAKGLLEYETLSGEEIKNLIKGIKPNRDDDLGRVLIILIKIMKEQRVRRALYQHLQKIKIFHFQINFTFLYSYTL